MSRPPTMAARASRHVLVVILLAALLGGCARTPRGERGAATISSGTPSTARGDEGIRPALVIAHRGASGTAPEHTIASYDLALELGADYIEQDLQQTSDGVLVVLHDETLDRTARGAPENCTGAVATKTLAQLKTCDVGSWFNGAYPQRAQSAYVGLRIPTLEELFQRYEDRANFYIETKSPEQADRMEERLVELLERHNLGSPNAARQRVLLQSFSSTGLKRLHALDPALPLVQLYTAGETSRTIQATLDGVAGYAIAIGPSMTDVDAALVAAAHAHCLALHPYTVNERAEMRHVLALGVDGMFTNFPRELREIVGTTDQPATSTVRFTAPATCPARR